MIGNNWKILGKSCKLIAKQSENITLEQPVDLAARRRLESNPLVEKSYTLIEQLSPDLLFARSILRINNPEFSDFGQYNCTVSNSLGQDSMRIDLLPTAPNGKCLCIQYSQDSIQL